MKSAHRMLDERVPETVVLHVDHSASPERRKAFIGRLEPILPHLNWRTHLFIVSEAPAREIRFSREILRALARFLVEKRLASFYVHPVIRIGRAGGAGPAAWQELLDEIRPFQRQAYEQQTESRLSILPILDPEAGTAERDLLRAVDFFLERAAKPSLVVRGRGESERLRAAAGQEVRFYVEPDRRSGARGLIRQLWVNRVFESLLERIGSGVRGAGLLAPCRAHLVIDQPSDAVYSCFHDWSAGRPIAALEELSRSGAGVGGGCGPEACPGCIGPSLRSMTENLLVNQRAEEGRKVHLELALALSAGRRHREATLHAARARELASSGPERARASIVAGLCRLELGELEEAERSLAEAAGAAEDPGLVSFHRGRVQFEWRDYIEALERFEEALASGSEAVPRAELFHYMAVSHVHLHEYREARPYLERWEETGQDGATMLYFRGLCDLGEGRLESALVELRAAEGAGLARQERGNALFYSGYCLKELGRYEEAIAALGRAAELDPGEVAVLNLLGFCFYKTARHAEAVDCFERAVARDPRSAIDHANLARNLSALGRTDAAIESYRTALSLDPHLGFAREQLGKLTGGSG